MMRVQFSPDVFRARLNQAMRIPEFGALTLELTSVTEARYSTPEHPAFSLLLRGPLDPQLEQRTYAFEFADASTLDMFIVPVGRDASGMQYEAVFN